VLRAFPYSAELSGSLGSQLDQRRNVLIGKSE